MNVTNTPFKYDKNYTKKKSNTCAKACVDGKPANLYIINTITLN